jgi:drug/metabolite transporter (DMT)-like permease
VISTASYLLIPLMAFLLVSAQAFWNSAIKGHQLLKGSASTVFSNLISSPKIWAGVLLYIATTAVYFILLSKTKFFTVQVTMTALSIIFSTLMAALFFHEKISLINVAGMLVVLMGLPLVLSR